ncbi:hypothetical protein TNIN_208081 [Trichonephila inaurata madagascariensis]|uniref:Uncharacterized protein n=1 Tax=Trichonephila inaurata madagascariensis TaxID=2747483 RepID=A0A8X6XCD4_9ARAC|nr:hypothetical protein TNIN_453671 [Trichonephila inaurata madagascariensis]GFY50142.1 hypothetical protein TNIN_208081 [Trichonephila inaurata madagascariensis]
MHFSHNRHHLMMIREREERISFLLECVGNAYFVTDRAFLESCFHSSRSQLRLLSLEEGKPWITATNNPPERGGCVKNLSGWRYDSKRSLETNVRRGGQHPPRSFVTN